MVVEFTSDINSSYREEAPNCPHSSLSGVCFYIEMSFGWSPRVHILGASSSTTRLHIGGHKLTFWKAWIGTVWLGGDLRF